MRARKRRHGVWSPAFASQGRRAEQPPSLSCTAAKNLHTWNCRAVSEVASHVFPDHAFRDRSAVQPQRRSAALEEDARLRTDIRLLGRILGDTVRDQEGADVFDLVERIRQTSIRFHRDEDKLARRELEIILDSMSTSETVRIVRAFSYFSHLANIAEDQNNIRQMRGAWRRRAAGEHAYPDTVACKDGRLQRRRPAPILWRGPDQPGTDRASDGSSPQEHDRPRDGDRDTARPPRTRPADAGGGRGQRRAVAPRGADAVADEPPAPDQADRAG